MATLQNRLASDFSWLFSDVPRDHVVQLPGRRMAVGKLRGMVAELILLTNQQGELRAQEGFYEADVLGRKLMAPAGEVRSVLAWMRTNKLVASKRAARGVYHYMFVKLDHQQVDWMAAFQVNPDDTTWCRLKACPDDTSGRSDDTSGVSDDTWDVPDDTSSVRESQRKSTGSTESTQPEAGEDSEHTEEEKANGEMDAGSPSKGVNPSGEDHARRGEYAPPGEQTTASDRNPADNLADVILAWHREDGRHGCSSTLARRLAGYVPPETPEHLVKAVLEAEADGPIKKTWGAKITWLFRETDWAELAEWDRREQELEQNFAGGDGSPAGSDTVLRCGCGAVLKAMGSRFCCLGGCGWTGQPAGDGTCRGYELAHEDDGEPSEAEEDFA